MTRQQIIDAYDAMSRIDTDLIAAAERETGFLSYVEENQSTKKGRKTMSAGAIAACIAGFAVVLYVGILLISSGKIPIASWFSHETGTDPETFTESETPGETLPETEPMVVVPADGVFTAYIRSVPDTHGSIFNTYDVMKEEDCLYDNWFGKTQQLRHSESVEATLLLLNEKRTVQYTEVGEYENFLGEQIFGRDKNGMYYVDAATGVVTEWFSLPVTSAGEPLTEDQLLSIAKVFYAELSAAFDVKGEYVLLEADDTSSGTTERSFVFARMVNDIPSPERIIIILKSDGTLNGYSVRLPNLFYGIVLPDDYRKQSTDAAHDLLWRLVSQMPGFGGSDLRNEKPMTIVRLPDERVALQLNVTVSVTTIGNWEYPDETYINVHAEEPVTVVIPISLP